MILGTRFTAKKHLPRVNPNRRGPPILHPIEVWHHVLHATKGWRLTAHFTRAWSSKNQLEYKQAPLFARYWRPIKRRFLYEPRSLETPLTRAKHYHPRSLRHLAIAAAKRELDAERGVFRGIKLDEAVHGKL